MPKDSLRIAVFANTLPPLSDEAERRQFGGVEVACLSLCRAMAARGHDVWAFATTVTPGGAAESLDQGSLHVRILPRTFRVGLTPASVPMWWRPGHELSGCDVVLAYMGDQPAPTAALRWARRWRAPLVVSFHGDSVTGFGSAARRLGIWLHERWLGPRVLRAASAIIALSHAAAASSRLLQEHTHKVTVISNGVDAQAAWSGTKAEARARHGLPPPNVPLALFVGSLTPIKGVDVLLEAWARRPPGDEAVLAVAGVGSEEQALREQARRAGLGDRVRFLGFVSASSSGLLVAADVLVLPSRSESFPLTILEAGINRLPVVASRLPVLEAMVEDGVTGILVPPDDPLALSQALGSLLARPDRGAAMGAAGRSWAERHTWPQAAEQTERLLRDCLAKAG